MKYFLWICIFVNQNFKAVAFLNWNSFAGRYLNFGCFSTPYSSERGNNIEYNNFESALFLKFEPKDWNMSFSNLYYYQILWIKLYNVFWEIVSLVAPLGKLIARMKVNLLSKKLKNNWAYNQKTEHFSQHLILSQS